MESYTADDIRILEVAESRERFLFTRSEYLTKKYPATSPEFINRLLVAAAVVNEPIELVIRRYLDRDQSIILSPEFTAAYLEAMKDRYLIPSVPNGF